MNTKNLRIHLTLFVTFIMLTSSVLRQTTGAKPNHPQMKSASANQKTSSANKKNSQKNAKEKNEPRAELVVQTGHSPAVLSVTFSPDGKTLASAGHEDGTVKLWNVESGKELRTLSRHFGPVSSAVFSPDGKTIASGSWDKTIKLWDVENGKEIKTLKGHLDAVKSVVSSPDGKTLASGSDDKTIKLWDVKGGKELRTFSGHSSFVLSVVFSPDGKTIASGSWDKTIKLWDVENGKEIKTLKGHSDAVGSITFSLDGKTLASGSDDETIKLWNVENGIELRTFQGHSDAVISITFSPDGKTLVSGSNDKTIKLWDVESGKELRTFSGHSSSVLSAGFRPDGKMLASAGGADRTIKLWDVESGKEIKTLKGHSDAVSAVTFSPDGKTLVSGSGDKTIKLWDVKGGKELRILSGHFDAVRSVAFSPDGKTLVSAGYEDDAVKLWDVESGKELRTFSGHSGWVLLSIFSPDGKTLASAGSFDRIIKLWDVGSGKELRTLKGHSHFISEATFSPDGKTLVSGSHDKTIKLWDVESGKELMTFSGHSSVVGSVTFSPDGKTFASGSNDKTIKLWDVESGKELRTFSGHSDAILSVAFSSEGKTLASGSSDETFKVWDVMGGKELETLDGYSTETRQKIGKLFPRLYEDCYQSTVSEEFIAEIVDTVKLKLFARETQKELATLTVLDRNDWVVVTPEGRFDTNKNLDSAEGLHWVVSDDPMKPVPLEIFMRDYYEPKLLQRVLKCNEKGNCDEEFAPLPNIVELNRVQPRVKITNVSVPDATRKVKVTVEVSKGSIPVKDCRMKRCETEAFDMRLFRDGQLVGSFPNSQEKLIKQRENEIADINGRKKIWRESARISLDEKTEKKILTFDVQLPKGKNVSDIDFTAYAFNEDRVKSDTAKWNWSDETKAKLPNAEKVNRRAFILSVGVNASENERWRLQFAARDATETQRILTEKLKAVGEYEILNIPLISDYDAQKNLVTNDAVKKKIEAVFALLAGKKLNDEQQKLIDEVKQNAPDVVRLLQMKPTPDDMVIISFSSHGYADNRGNFYLLPYDIGKDSREMKDAVHLAISSDELSLWLRDVDAGDMAMIIDACHAAASVENREFKPGPMGSRGLGQLAYDKDMKILTATKADDVALEVGGRLNQGLLSYALLREGLEKSLADFKAQDGKIFLKEWLEYGETRVPSLYDDVKNNRLKDAKGIMLKGSEPLTTVLNKQDTYQQRPSLFNFSRKTGDIIISTQKL